MASFDIEYKNGKWYELSIKIYTSGLKNFLKLE